METKKIYIPYDYRTIMRGYVEIDVTGKSVTKIHEDIQNGVFDPMREGVKLKATEVVRYDENCDGKTILSEEQYLEDKELKHTLTTKGFSPTATRRDEM